MEIKFNHIIFLIIILALVTLMPINSHERLNVVGSTSIQPICEELSEEYKKIHKDIDINIQGGGSSLGIKSTKANIAEIGMSSKDVNDSNLQIHELGFEGIVVIVNNQNPVKDLSVNEIKDIFSGNITTWDDKSKINVIVREEGSGTLDVFKSKIMGNSTIKTDAIVQNSAGCVRQSVIQDKNSIGFVSLNHLDGKVKDISINGVSANKESILNGDYPLQRPFLLLTNKTPSQKTSDFINWTKTEDAVNILESQKIFVSDKNDK